MAKMTKNDHAPNLPAQDGSSAPKNTALQDGSSAPKNTATQDEIPYTQSSGLDYTILLAFKFVDESTLTKGRKRDVLYSLLCFRCLFDNRMAVDPDPVLLKYNCLQMPEPAKLEPYEIVHTVASLTNASVELKGQLYQMFPTVVLIESPHDHKLYSLLKALLCTQEVLDAVLKSRFSIHIPLSVREMWAADLPATVVDWYLPYLSYKDERDEKGLSREVKECQRLLGLGRFDESLARAERLLDCMPDDENVLLCDVAARVSLPGKPDDRGRLNMLHETLQMIDATLQAENKPLLRKNYFLYYRGLALLGLMHLEEAENQFRDLLSEFPNFELAAFMLKGLSKAKSDKR